MCVHRVVRVGSLRNDDDKLECHLNASLERTIGDQKLVGGGAMFDL